MSTGNYVNFFLVLQSFPEKIIPSKYDSPLNIIVLCLPECCQVEGRVYSTGRPQSSVCLASTEHLHLPLLSEQEPCCMEDSLSCLH